jgi:mono/diheme cytochrome c family protein
MGRLGWCVAWLWLVAAPLSGQEPVVYLDQGWNAELRNLFYFTPQGSRLMPAAWFMALEAKDGGQLFSSRENLSQYGFIYAEGASPLNPHRLPIGFALDKQAIPEGGVSVGLTCAACHTADVLVQGKRLRIDGGPANLDFDAFFSDLAGSVHRTFHDQAAFQRFAARLIPEPTPAKVEALRKQFAKFQTLLAGEAVIRRPAHPSGFGRVDALTQIINSLAVVSQKDPLNVVAPNAPTSYPHLWLTPQLEFVQWNPIASSPIGRNGGEVLGVFGTSRLHGSEPRRYESSLLIRELGLLEKWVEMLKPPKWNEALFGAINRDLANQGKVLYERHCVSCHTVEPFRMTDPAKNQFGKRFIEIGRVDYRKIGTDPLYVQALLERTVRTNAATRAANGGQEIVPALQFFLNAVGPVVERAMNEAQILPAERLELSGYRFRPPAVAGQRPQSYVPPSFADLKAGPLVGIWATGPFLHNGSVPTIDDLLKPANQRPAEFWTGFRELDREKLGFVSTSAPNRHKLNTKLPGNGNQGHEYPREPLLPTERKALIEFLKSL